MDLRFIDADAKPAVTTGHVMSMDELANVKGRGWEDIDVRGMTFLLFARSGKLTPITALTDDTIRVCQTAAWVLRSSEPFLHPTHMKCSSVTQDPPDGEGLEVISPRLPDKENERHSMRLLL